MFVEYLKIVMNIIGLSELQYQRRKTRPDRLKFNRGDVPFMIPPRQVRFLPRLVDVNKRS